MTNLFTHVKAVLILLAVVAVWAVFIFDTWFGYLQIAILLLSALFNLSRWPLAWFVERWPWQKLFLVKYDTVRHQLNSWCLTIWLANDQYINAIFKGSEDHSISGRVGFAAMKGNKTALVIEKIIDFVFFAAIGQRGHCRANIEMDEVWPQ